MLDPKVTDLADRMIEIQFGERDKQLERDILLIQNDAAMRGMGTSTAFVEALYDACARDVELRAHIVWNNLMKVLSRAGVVASPTLSADLKLAMSRYEQAIYAEPAERLSNNARAAGLQPRESLINAAAHAVHKVHAEIDLFVLGLEQQRQADKNRPEATFNFYSPVGAVQTGPNASAQVFQNITPQDREALLGAISLLRQELVSVTSLPACPKEEIVELVEEAEIETKKAKPNSSKLLGMFTVIAQAIQTVASLKPAYDALKAALLPFGVMLP